MLFRSSRLLWGGFLILLIFGFFLIWKQTSYERSLAAASITFDDFPPKYAKALRSSQLAGKNTVYDRPPQSSPSLSSAPDGQTTIPPIIHFIWFKDLYNEHLDISEIPRVGSEAPKECRRHNLGYEVLTWNETAARSLLENHYSSLVPLYDAYRYPIQRVDLFKYVVLWHYGGVYMDLDIACGHELDALLPFPAWYPKASPFGVNNDLMASRAGHPFVGFMLDHLEGRNRNLLFPYLTIFWSTGPQFTSDMLSYWYWYRKTRSYVPGTNKANYGPDMVYVLPQEFYSEEYTFFGHSPGGTWHGQDVAVVLWFVAHPLMIALSLSFLCFVVLFICLRLRRKPARSKIAGRKIEMRTA